MSSRQMKEESKHTSPDAERMVLQEWLWTITVTITGPKLPDRFMLQDRMAHHVPNWEGSNHCRQKRVGVEQGGGWKEPHVLQTAMLHVDLYSDGNNFMCILMMPETFWLIKRLLLAKIFQL